MPILPPSLVNPLDTVEMALNAARVRLNDAMQSLSGDVLTDSQPFTQQVVNNAWRRLQNYLSNHGYMELVSEAVLTSVPSVGSIDPASQAYISWTECFDGASYFQSPLLPATLIQPIRLWERISGSGSDFSEMTFWDDGLPTIPKQGMNGLWEWRGNGLFMPGAQNVTDIRIRFKSYFPDFVTIGQSSWTAQPIPIMRCLDAFSCFIAYETASARGDLDSSVLLEQGKEQAGFIFNRDIGMKNRTTVRRKPHSWNVRRS